MQAGKDYNYFYIGIIPHIVIKHGEYKGLQFALDGAVIRSVCADGEVKHTLESNYTLEKEWDAIPAEQKNGNKITFTPKDQDFLNDVIYSFVEEINT